MENTEPEPTCGRGGAVGTGGAIFDPVTCGRGGAVGTGGAVFDPVTCGRGGATGTGSELSTAGGTV